MAKLTFLLASFLVGSMVLCASCTNTSNGLFSMLPNEILHGQILRLLNPSSLMFLCMTSKDLIEPAESELYYRCDENFCELLEEQKRFYENSEGKFCSLEKFIRRVWPKSNHFMISLKLNEALRSILESLQGFVTPLQSEYYDHIKGFSVVTKTILKMRLAESICITMDLLNEVPWSVISEFADGEIRRVTTFLMVNVGCEIVNKRRFHLLEDMITDKRIGSRVMESIPFSDQFLKTLIATKSLEITLDHSDYDISRRGTGANGPHRLFEAILPFSTLVRLFKRYGAYSTKDSCMFIAKLINYGYEPDMSWFDNVQLFAPSLIDSIKSCLSNKDISSLEKADKDTAVLYLILNGIVDGKSVSYIQTEIKKIAIGPHEFRPSTALRQISRKLWMHLPSSQRNFFEIISDRKSIFLMHEANADRIIDQYEEGIMSDELFSAVLMEAIETIHTCYTTFSDMGFSRLFEHAERLGILDSLASYSKSHYHLAVYLSMKPIPELMASMSQIQNFQALRNLESCIANGLRMKEGGIQALRNAYPRQNLVFLAHDDLRNPEATLITWLDRNNPDILILLDHFLFNPTPLFKVSISGDWPKHRRFRLDLALAKITSLYSASLQVIALKNVGIDKDNLLSMYMVRALMSSPEGRKYAQELELVSDADLEMATIVCNSTLNLQSAGFKSDNDTS